MSEQIPTVIAPVGRRSGNTAGASASKTVWRKGWRRDAAATQAASAAVSGVIGWFEQEGFPEIADQIRQSAIQHGARKAEAQLSRQITAWIKRLKKHGHLHD